MTRLRSPAGLSNAIIYLLLALFALPTQALYFYMKDGSPKCFHEELPKDTLVVGMFALLLIYFHQENTKSVVAVVKYYP